MGKGIREIKTIRRPGRSEQRIEAGIADAVAATLLRDLEEIPMNSHRSRKGATDLGRDAAGQFAPRRPTSRQTASNRFVSLQTSTDNGAGVPDRVGICHCTDCRQESGSAFHVFGIWPAGQFEQTGQTARPTSPLTCANAPACGVNNRAQADKRSPRKDFMCRLQLAWRDDAYSEVACRLRS